MKSGHTELLSSLQPGQAVRLAVLALGLSPLAAGGPATSAPPIQQTDWAIVPIRALNGEPQPQAAARDGLHLIAPDAGAPPAGASLGPELPTRLAEDLAMAAATAAGGNVQLLDGSLLVRGPAPSHAAARDALEALEGALSKLRFDVNVRLTVAGSDGPPLIDGTRLVRAGGVVLDLLL